MMEPEAMAAAPTSFSEDNWAEWLERFLRGEPSPPLPDSGEAALFLQVLSLYRTLPEGPSGRFEQAVLRVFTATAESASNAERLFHLLQLIGAVKPLGADRVLRQRLLQERMRGIRFEGSELQTLLLVVLTEYGVDDELAYYMQRTADARGDLRYVLICLRLLAPLGQNWLDPLLNRAITLTVNDADVALLRRAVHGIVLGKGYRWLFTWLRVNWPIMMQTAASNLLRFGRAVLPLLEREQGDPYAASLNGLFQAYVSSPAAQVLPRIALFRDQVGEAEAQWVLARMWNALRQRFPSELPWLVFYFPPVDQWDRDESGVEPFVELRTVSDARYRARSDLEITLLRWLDRTVDENPHEFPTPKLRQLPGAATNASLQRTSS